VALAWVCITRWPTMAASAAMGVEVMARVAMARCGGPVA
jgi:hypothetical protein